MFSKDDYEKLSAGNDKSHNHWHCFLESDLFYIYKGFGGVEHYRFALHRQDSGSYLVNEIEVRNNSGFYENTEREGCPNVAIEEHKATVATDAIEEVASMLLDFFGVKV